MSVLIFVFAGTRAGRVTKTRRVVEGGEARKEEVERGAAKAAKVSCIILHHLSVPPTLDVLEGGVGW